MVEQHGGALGERREGVKYAEPLSNRDKARVPRGHGFWCGGCDRCIVREGAKCKACGTRNGKRRYKP